MIHTSIPRDEPPDTRNEAETRRLDGLYGIHGDTVVPPIPTSADFNPDTSPSVDILANNPNEPKTDAPEAYDKEEPPAEFTKIISADRKTLPSAQFPPNPARNEPNANADLSWDQEPEPKQPPPKTNTPFPEQYSEFPEENPEQGAESTSLWGRVQKFVAKLGKKQTSTAPPAPAARISGERPALQTIFNAAWTLDDGEIDALAEHLEKILALRRLGTDAYTEARILETLKSPNPQDEKQSTTVSTLRAKLPEISKHAFDEALLRLEERQSITLGPADEIAEQPRTQYPKRNAS